MDHEAFSQLLGNYGEFVGAVAVVFTLVYLARQVSHSVELARTSQKHGIMEAYAHWNEMVISSPKLMDFLERMEDPNNEVTDDDSVVSRHFIYRTYNIYNLAQAAFDSNLISREEFAFFENDIIVQMRTYPGMQKRMNEVLSRYPDAKKWQIYKAVGTEIEPYP